jgi:hypothetical protein
MKGKDNNDKEKLYFKGSGKFHLKGKSLFFGPRRSGVNNGSNDGSKFLPDRYKDSMGNPFIFYCDK